MAVVLGLGMGGAGGHSAQDQCVGWVSGVEDRGEAAHQVGGGVGGHKVAEACHTVRGLLHRRR